MTLEETSPSLATNLVTVKQLSDLSPAFTESSLRSLIFNSKTNGLEGAIVRIGRRVLIDCEAFDRWLNRQRRV